VRRLVVQVQAPVADADEYVACTGQNLIQDHLAAEHLGVEAHAGFDIGRERVNVVKTVAHGILRVCHQTRWMIMRQ
jgi:hypothetical protein